MVNGSRISRSPMFEHGVHNDQQFAYAGDKGDLLYLPGYTQTLIERTNHGIKSHGDDCPIYSRPHMSKNALLLRGGTDGTYGIF